MRSLFVISSLLVLAACTMRKPKFPFVGEEKLSSTFYTIDPTRDTTITTAQGALLTIPAAAIVADPAGGGAALGAGSTVRLEVKEAYAMADIIRGGLVTASEGRPLSTLSLAERISQQADNKNLQ
jgi:hypothetical protein